MTYEILKDENIKKFVVWKTTQKDNGFNIKGVFSAKTRKECELWIKELKK